MWYKKDWEFEKRARRKELLKDIGYIIMGVVVGFAAGGIVALMVI